HKGALTDPWAGFSLKNEVQHVEQRFIELALRDSDGMVSRAARLLGFKHHESLNSLLNNRFQHLLDARTTVSPRRRSIVRERAA
ncbi:MAG TPA: helix-turn-helix domain-containing protein, partial [Pyrinomonadaceae bacterium]|nr:helix-turn-helix domain-containing protein [Pyrinomonadaceae bacterium]